MDITGKRYGRLVVIERANLAPHGHWRWHVKCDCGNKKSVEQAALISGVTVSCGCYRLERVREAIAICKTTHGKSKTPTYRIWRVMLNRCDHSSQDSYKYYGGRGIKVCERWRKFENFLSDMGEKPDGLTLDRKKSEGNYEPGNCRWATWTEQRMNQRRMQAHG